MVQQLIQGRRIRYTAFILLLIWSMELFFPSIVYALTSGPTQPEVQAFMPAGGSQLVDITSGNFSYNIPLLEVPGPDGGYPINLGYRAGIGVDQEASWVGLGWNLNPGAITRQMRGLPDEFNGDKNPQDKVTETLDMKTNFTIGIEPSLSRSEIFGFNSQNLDISAPTDPSQLVYNGTAELTETTVNSSKNWSLGLGLTYNNYKGIGVALKLNGGYDFSRSVQAIYQEYAFAQVDGGFQYHVLDEEKIPQSKTAFNLSGSINLDNLNGPSLSLAHNIKGVRLQLDYNTRNLFQYSLAPQFMKGYGSGFSLSHTPLDNVPQIPLEMIGTSISGLFTKANNAFIGTYMTGSSGSSVSTSSTETTTNKSWSIRAYLDWSKLKYKKRENRVLAYGYLHNQPISKTGGLSDLNRHQDPNDIHTRFLPIPSATYDIYTATGQGFLGTFRPYRTEMGTYADKKATTKKSGPNFELEYAKNQKTTVVNGTPNIKRDKQWGWSIGGTIVSSEYRAGGSPANDFQFHSDRSLASGKSDPVYEPYHFRMYGEAVPETENMPQLQEGEPLRAVSASGGLHDENEDFSSSNTQWTWDNHLVTETEDTDQMAYNPTSIDHGNFRVPIEERAQRSTLIQPISNELLQQNPPAGFNIIDKPRNFNRSNYPLHHPGGFVNTTSSGVRYVYGLPNYNIAHEEYTFSVRPQQENQYPESVPLDVKNDEIQYEMPRTTDVNKKSDNYYQKREVGSYAHSYWLTGILGADYIDTQGNGMSDDDLGGWIKFNYQTFYSKKGDDASNTSESSFPWRAPFSDADYMKNLHSKKGDDKASFLYGTKEIRYLRMVETTSHVAFFFISKRLDGYGPKQRLQNDPSDETNVNLIDTEKPLYKLDKIKLYSKEALKINDDWTPPQDYISTTQDWNDYFDNEVKTIKKTAPIKTIYFRYTYELNRGVPNNINYHKFKELGKKLADGEFVKPQDITPELLKQYSRSGKLTLKEVYFTYGRNDQGKFSPYEFDYGSIEKWETHQKTFIDSGEKKVTPEWGKIVNFLSSIKDLEAWRKGPTGNLHYQRGQLDIWGNYKPRSENEDITPTGSKEPYSNKEYPYLIQPQIDLQKPIAKPEDIQVIAQHHHQRLNKYVALWSIKRITLPSGGHIYIGYEADDYGYVQNQHAMQLLPVTGFGLDKSNSIEPKTSKEAPRVYFKLQKPIVIPTDIDDRNEMIKQELQKYVQGLQQVYFRTEIFLKKNQSSTQELVKGYAELDYEDAGSIQPEGKIWVGEPDDTSPANAEYYREAYITLKPFRADGQEWHPIATAAWQFLQQFRPEIIYKHSLADLEEKHSNKLAPIIKACKDVVSFASQIAELGAGFYRMASIKEWGRETVAETAFIRLNVPDGNKIGGGHRVKYLITDNGNAEATQANIYGTVYQYQLDNDQSSGVATYEPPTGGGEENPLHTAKFGRFNVKGKVFEHPVNEAYFPAPSVGYSRVITQSLASYVKQNKDIKEEIDSYYFGQKPASLKQNISIGERIGEHFKGSDYTYQTSGITESVFYTCKDFPVIVSHTGMTSAQSPAMNLNLLLFGIEEKYTSAFQGYAIELNDMHLKPHWTATYAQKQNGTPLMDKPVSKVVYYYGEKTRGQGDQAVQVPDNLVPALYQDYNGEVRRSDLTDPVTSNVNEAPWIKIGHSEEVFADARIWKDKISKGALNHNLIKIDIKYPEIPPLPSLVPTGFQSTTTYKTHVINKITHRTGVLKKIETHDGSAISIIENILWDAKTGQVVLTKALDNFGQAVFSYNIPAHFKYPRMGHAYKNTGMKFKAKLDLYPDCFHDYCYEIRLLWNYQIANPIIPTETPIKIYSEHPSLDGQPEDYKIKEAQGELIQQVNLNKETLLRIGTNKDLQAIHYSHTPLAYYIQIGQNMLKYDNTNVFLMPESTSPELFPLNVRITDIPDNVGKHLVVGDEFLIGEESVPGVISEINNVGGNYELQVILLKKIVGGEHSFYLYRSGRRNLLGASVGNVTALTDPTDSQNRTSITDTKKIQKPACDTCNPKN